MTRKRAIELIEFALYCYGRANITGKEKTVEMLQLSLAALLDQEKRENPKPLTLEELMNLDAPVYAGNKDFPDADGFWCICHNGHIVCPSGMSYGADELPSWVFYRYKPKGDA